MRYIGIAPHKDDEIVGFGTLLKAGFVRHIFFVTDADDGREEMARRVCKDYGVSHTMLPYTQLELVNMIEDERKAMIKEIRHTLYGLGYDELPWLIPSCIDRNVDHTVLGGWLPRYAPKGSLFYSYTDTLPEFLPRLVEPMDDKNALMKKYYPIERKILDEKKIIYPFCYYGKITS